MLYYGGLIGAKIENDNHNAAVFHLGALNSGWTSDGAIRDLERDLDLCQQRLNLARRWHEEGRSHKAQGPEEHASRPESTTTRPFFQQDDAP